LNAAAGTQVKFGVDGGSGGADKTQLDAAVRSLVRWVRDHVTYLPGKNPETFVWDNMSKTTETAEFDSIPDPKKRFDVLARKELGRASFEQLSSQDILATQLRKLATIPDNQPELVSLKKRLSEALAT
jgi:hypothetical protein